MIRSRDKKKDKAAADKIKRRQEARSKIEDKKILKELGL